MMFRAVFIGLSGLVCLTAWKGSCGPETGGEGGSTQTGGQAGCPESGGAGGAAQTGGQGGSTQTGGQGGGGAGGSTVMAPMLTVLSTTNGGPGCPVPGSVSVDPLPGDGLSLGLPDLTVSHAPGTGYAHTSCVTGVTVRGVPGMQFAATGAQLSGRAALPGGVTAGISTSTFFAGNPASSDLTLDYTGPHDGPIVVESEAEPDALVASPCGADAIFNVQVSLSLNLPDPATGNVTITNAAIPIKWNTCSR